MRDGLNASSTVARSPGLIESAIDNEIVALNIETGTCYGLNATGSRIWTLLARPVRISDICAALVDEYQVDATTCEAEVIDLIEHLIEENLVVVASRE